MLTLHLLSLSSLIKEFIVNPIHIKHKHHQTTFYSFFFNLILSPKNTASSGIVIYVTFTLTGNTSPFLSHPPLHHFTPSLSFYLSSPCSITHLSESLKDARAFERSRIQVNKHQHFPSERIESCTQGGGVLLLTCGFKVSAFVTGCQIGWDFGTVRVGCSVSE